MARAAVAAGADGLIIEVHPDPDQALSDGAQSLYPEQFAKLMAELRIIAPARMDRKNRRVNLELENQPRGPFSQITVIGTGLIGGGCLGLPAQGAAASRRTLVIGCDRPPVLERALHWRHRRSTSECCGGAMGSQVVVLAVPIGASLDLIDRLAPSLPTKTLLTDVGSTKAAVLDRASKAFGKNVGKRFLAGHPMAGKEHSGIEFADPELFQGADGL